MHSRSDLRRLAALLIAITGSLPFAGYGQSAPPGDGTTSTPGSVLPRKVVVRISVVNRFFTVTREASTAANLTAVGNPKATRSVIYANSDSSKKMTITVDQYASPTDASSAYQEAVQKSKIVPGFEPVSASDLGQNAFIGTVTQGNETHIGLGTLQGTLIIGATLVGYDPTPDNIAKLVSVTREEEAAAKAALDRKAQD
jgi:hypothetical protein